MHPDSTDDKKGPKTDLDKKFLYVVEQAMSLRGIQSDRAMSIELDRHPNFINRVRNGLQSAPPDAWDALFAKYPAARSISTTNVTATGGGQAIGNVEGDANYTIGDCERERDAFKTELELVRQQLVDKDKLITALEGMVASKEEIISLLRGGYNRPN